MPRDRRARNVSPANGSPQPGQGEVQGLVALYTAGRLIEAESQALKLVKKFPMALILFNILGAAQAGQGKFKEAAATHKRALKIKPDYAEAHYNLGYALQELGKFKDAADSYKRAIKCKPDFLEAQSNLGVALQRLGKLDEAIASYRQVIGINPDYADAHNNLGNALSELGKFDEAAEGYRRALQLVPNFPEAHKNLGKALYAHGKFDEAIASIEQSLKLKPDNAEAHNVLGVTLQALGQHDEAIASFDRALQFEPDNAEAYNNLGAVLEEQGKHEKAADSYRQAIGLKPDFAAAHSNLGVALQELRRLDEAADSYRQALAIEPDFATAHRNLGGVLRRLGRPDEAIAACEEALAIEPNYAEAHCNLGLALQDLGRIDDAVASYRKAIAGKPDYAEAYRHLAYAGRNTTRDDETSEMESLFAQPDCSSALKMDLGFGLAKAFDDAQQYDKSFDCLLEANRLKRATLSYSISETEQHFRELQGVFTRELFESGEKSGNRSDTPIFVLGMRRSGTSLVEQILASHRQVFGAGELPYMSAIVSRAFGELRLPFPEGVARLDPVTLGEIADSYLEQLRKSGGDAPYITDKMPNNYLNIGMIALALPAARIIHVRRDPMDTCFSIFANYFGGHVPYAYDLAQLGAYYRLYEELMDHWRSVLPNAMFEISYEKLIEAPEDNIRAMLDYCGLDFDPACLEFHKSDRVVRTASSWQVRQPLYKDSIARWRHYEHRLEALRTALEG